MQRFKQYLDKRFLFAALKDSEPLKNAGFRSDHLPDSMGNFEELEFSGDLNGQSLLMTVAVVKGQVKRIMFVMRKSADPDDVRPLTGAELEDLAKQKGDQLLGFFESITQ